MKLTILGTIAVSALFLRIANANANVIMECSITNADDGTTLVLSQNEGKYVLEKKLPFAEMPLAHLTVDSSQVFIGPSTVVVDAFESRVGNLQMVVTFDIGHSLSKSFSFTSDYRRSSIRQDYGLDAFKTISDSGLIWSCKR